jgi:hypothetical protein
MFWKRKHRVRADELATSLFNEFVQRPIGWDETLQIDTSITSESGRKVRLYQFASVLLAVLDAERRDAAFSPVRECLERHFFPPTFTEGAELLEEVRHAMKDLTELIQPDGQPRPMSWAVRWLSDVGIQQDNPATLMMFVFRWPSHFATVLEALREFKPVA